MHILASRLILKFEILMMSFSSMRISFMAQQTSRYLEVSKGGAVVG